MDWNEGKVHEKEKMFKRKELLVEFLNILFWNWTLAFFNNPGESF